MQVLWKYKLDWDESLPQSVHSSGLDHMSLIATVACLTFPRYVLQHNLSCKIHKSCDASIVLFYRTWNAQSQELNPSLLVRFNNRFGMDPSTSFRP